MNPLHHETQLQEVGTGTKLLNNAAAAAKFLAHIPEKAAGFVGRQAHAVYASLPLTHEKTEKGISNQEKKVATEPPKTTRSITGTLASLATGAETKVRRAFTQVTELPEALAAKVTQRVSVEEFQKKLGEVHTTQVKWCTANLTRNEGDVAAARDAARQQLSFAKLTCGDPKLVQQMQKSLGLTQGIVNNTAMAILKQKEKENFNQLQAMGPKFADSPQLKNWQAAHAELAEIADESSKGKLNNLVSILGNVKSAFAAIDKGEYEEARAILDFAENNLDDVKSNGYLPFDGIINEDKSALGFAILRARSSLPKQT